MPERIPFRTKDRIRDAIVKALSAADVEVDDEELVAWLDEQSTADRAMDDIEDILAAAVTAWARGS